MHCRAKNEYFVQYFIRALNDTSLLTADETSVSVDGWRRIRGAMLGAVLGAGGEMDSTIRAIAEDANLKMSAVLTGIKDEAHHILKLRSIEGKEMYDIAPDIADALREYVEFRRTGGKSLEPYLAQQDFFTGRPTLTEAIMREFFVSGQKPSVIAKTLNTYVKLAMLQDNESPALFEMEVTPRERLRELAVKNAHAELETESKAKVEMDAKAEAGKRNMVTAEERYSVEAVRRDVEDALARDGDGHYKVSGGKGVRFADSLPILEFLGIHANGVFTTAERVRKMANKHFMTEEQIARLAVFCEKPVAVFEGIDETGGIVILTDELAPCAKDGLLKPIMVLLRPQKGGDGGFVASAYSRTPEKESAYRAMRSRLRYLDKNKGQCKGFFCKFARVHKSFIALRYL